MQLTSEEWRPIQGYEGIYEVSNLGNIRSLDRYINTMNNGTLCTRFCKGRLLKIDYDKDGYARINLHFKQDKRFGVHRLVASAFIPNPANKPTVNHINGNKFDNRVENLEWATYQEQNDHAVSIGLRNSSTYSDRSAVKKKLSKSVRCIETGRIYDSMIEAERQLGLYSAAVHDSIKRRSKIHNEYSFELI